MAGRGFVRSVPDAVAEVGDVAGGELADLFEFDVVGGEVVEQAAALAEEDVDDVQFELVAPQPGVVTTTADPQPQGGKGGRKNKDGDTSHTPGEDGAGNSAG